jgi:hypothetical protein
VEITKTNANTLHVDLDLAADVNNFFDPDVDVDMDLQVTFTQDTTTTPPTWRLHLDTVASSVDVDYDWWQDIASIVADPLCVPYLLLADGDVTYHCAHSIESYAETRVERALQPIAESFNIGSTPNNCTPEIDIHLDEPTLDEIQFDCF